MIKSTISRLFRNVIQNFGYAKKFAFVSMSTTLAMKRIAARGIRINTVIDVGASNGSWSLAARQCWPDAHYHLVEANIQHQAALEAVCGATPRFSYVLAAASDEPGTIYFDGSDTFGGLAMKGPSADRPGVKGVPAVTLDGETKAGGWRDPIW